MKAHILLLLALVFSVTLKSQQSIFQPGDYRDGVYDKENSVNRQLIPYTYLREADVTWEKRVWRRVDVREKQNQPLYFPKEALAGRISLPQLVVKYLINGQLIAFDDEEFLAPVERSAIKQKMVVQGDSAEVEEFDENGNSYMVKKPGGIDSTWFFETFSSLAIKEDWFFDKQKSSLEVRIIGLGFYAPIKGKEDLGETIQFWVYYPACRPVFAKHEVFNTKNDSERRTFEDIFWKRQFASSITKESNVYDRKIENYSKGLDALLESDRIKQDIFRLEHDLWQF
jgi:gliding motility associated protien GldN